MMPNNMGNIMQMLPQIKQNPMSFFLRRRWNIPQNMLNDPEQIMNYLLQTGQINQQQVNAAYQQAQEINRQK